MVCQCRFTSMQNARSTFFTPTRLDVQINYRKPFSNVTSVEPAILINSFSGLCRILKVAFKNVWSFHANLNIEDAVISYSKESSSRKRGAAKPGAENWSE